MAAENALLESRAGYLVPLNKLPAERQRRLLAQAALFELRKKQQLFAQGDRDDYTYYVLEGTIEMHADGSLIKRVVGGEAASFQPLAQLQPRQMSAVATGPALVLGLRRSLLEQLLSTDSPALPATGTGAADIEVVEVDSTDDWLVTLLQSDLFTRVPPSNVQTLLDTLESIDVTAGQDIVRQGEPGDYYYVVQSGHCEVVRAGARGRPIKLAELGPGDTFGEEALVSDATRNATVRMLSDGALARLTKEDFARLIKAPLLDAVDLAEAERRVAAGARWLDVRFEDEHAHNGLPDSLNIPLGMLRMRMSELDPAVSYVAYCDTGGRSSSAAFLLAGHGFDACYVVDGAVAERGARPAAAPLRDAAIPDAAGTGASAPETGTPAAHDAPAAAPPPASGAAEETIATARRMMAEAASMKADAERVVREKLDAERERLAAEAARLHDQLAETARVREALDAEREAVDAEREAISADAARLEADAEERLRAAEARAQASMEAERRRLEALYQDQTERLEASRVDREAALREQLREELARERRKFEQAFLRATEELEQARVEREAARSAERSARAEAAALQAQFEAEQQRLKQAYQAALEQERARLQAEALRLDAQRAEAVRAREAAESARAEAERALSAARSAASPATGPSLVEVEQRANAAQRELQQARAAESAAAAAAHDNRQELERTYGTAEDIDLLLQRELADWVEEQDRLQQSTQQRDALARQKDMIARIRARADAAREEHASNTRSLLDDIEAQLRGR